MLILIAYIKLQKILVNVKIYFQTKFKNFKILIIGDERANYLDLKELKNLPSIDFDVKNGVKLPQVINLINKNISKKYNLIVIFAFHYDFVYMENVQFGSCDVNMMRLNHDVNLDEIVNNVEMKTKKWNRLYPSTKIMWLIPHAPDFLSYNMMKLKSIEINWMNVLNCNMENSFTSDYWHLSAQLILKLKNVSMNINIFPLTPVIFYRNESLIKTLNGITVPKFPLNHLRNGLYFTPITNTYFLTFFMKQINIIIDEDLKKDSTEDKAFELVTISDENQISERKTSVRDKRSPLNENKSSKNDRKAFRRESRSPQTDSRLSKRSPERGQRPSKKSKKKHKKSGRKERHFKDYDEFSSNIEQENTLLTKEISSESPFDTKSK